MRFDRFLRWYVDSLTDDQVLAALEDISKQQPKVWQLPGKPIALRSKRRREQLRSLWSHSPTMILKYSIDKALVAATKGTEVAELKHEAVELIAKHGMPPVIASLVLSGNSAKADFGFRLLPAHKKTPTVDATECQAADVANEPIAETSTEIAATALDELVEVELTYSALDKVPTLLRNIAAQLNSGHSTLDVVAFDAALAELSLAWQRYQEQHQYRNGLLAQINARVDEIHSNYADQLRFYNLTGHAVLEAATYQLVNNSVLDRAVELLQSLTNLLAQVSAVSTLQPESWEQEQQHYAQRQQLAQDIEHCVAELVTVAQSTASLPAEPIQQSDGDPPHPDPEGMPAAHADQAAPPADADLADSALPLPSHVASSTPASPTNTDETPAADTAPDPNTSTEQTPQQRTATKQVTPTETKSPETTTTQSDHADQEVPPSVVIDAAASPMEEHEPPAGDLDCISPKKDDADPAIVTQRRLVWQLLGDDRCSLAYHIAQEMGRRYPDEPCKLPTWLVRATALGRHVYGSNSNLAQLIQEDFEQYSEECFQAGKADWNHAVRFLIVAAAARPAIVAPSSNAALLLDALRMKEGLGELYRFNQTVVEFANRRYSLDASDLKRVKDMTARDTQLQQLYHEVDCWQAEAATLNVSSAPVRYIWRSWQEADGLLYKLLTPIQNKDEGRLTEVTALAQDMAEEAYIDAQIDATQRLNRKAVVSDPKDLRQFKRRIRAAVALAERWVNLVAMHPGASSDSIHQIIDAFSSRLSTLLPKVQAELDLFEKVHHTSLVITASIACCRRTLAAIEDLFNPDVALPETEPNPRHILSAELLRIAGLDLDDDWEPLEPDADRLDKLTQLAAEAQYSWQQVLESHCQQKDHLGTQRVLELLKSRQEVADDTVAELAQWRQSQVAECQRSLAREIGFTRQEVERALTSNLLDEAEYQHHNAQLQQLEDALPDILIFQKQHDYLAAMRAAITQARAAQIELVRTRLQESAIAKDHPSLSVVEDALDKGDIPTANEYIDLLERGEAIPSTVTPDRVFDEFYPKGVQQIEAFLETPHSKKGLVENIRKRKKQALPVIDINKPAGRQTDEAAERMKTWFRSKERRGSVEPTAIKEMMSHLGFTVKTVDVEQNDGRTWVDVYTEPLTHREQCPVPAYGSAAKGHYRVFCAWDRPTEEDLVHSVGNKAQLAPVIVLYFGRLSEGKRRNLARVCRERRSTLLVVDEILMYFLCGVAGARLPVFFACALPFTFLEPYSITSSLVEAEMFYGRQRAREEIKNPRGSCFIYGGRQLGKTALLRDVERNYHQPDGVLRAAWIDLKSRGIGLDRPLDDIWVVLIDELKRIGVLPTTIQPNATVKAIAEHVFTWLNQNQERRVLLLLDEADRFLESDAKEYYKRTDKLKDIMDRTDRRFKVVFAGLHNVQKIARTENHPFGHFGEPICIGPLLEGGEWREARALVTTPLESLGFVFEEPKETGIDLVTRILSQTNYYPSLIQVYCRYLLLHMHSPSRMERLSHKGGPPYVITGRDIDEVYTRQDMREAMRQRFMLTLQLDARFDFLAHLIGYYSLESKAQIGEGFSVSWVRQQAFALWADGFQIPESQSAEEYFRMLLGEMVGLGVLRVTSDERYALRNANVSLLMGTQEEVLSQLFRPREAPFVYDPHTFRRALRKGKTNYKPYPRSPLTVYQDNLLERAANGVSVVIGCSAGGLDQVEEYLQASFPSFVPLSDCMGRAQFAEALSQVTSSRKKKDRGTLVVLIPATCPWGEVWVKEVLACIRRRRSTSSFLQIVFIADPDTAWQLAGSSEVLQTYSEEGVHLIHLQPWHEATLRQVLDDCNIGPQNAQMRARIQEVTGLWSELIVDYLERVRENPVAWEEPLAVLETRMADKESALSLAKRFGLDHSRRYAVLALMHAYGEASPEDIASLADGIPAMAVNQILQWAKLLNYAKPTQDNRWQCNPAVGQLAQCLKGLGL